VSEITRALWITLVGMGLTFLGILIIWGMMILFVKWMPEKGKKEEPETQLESATPIPSSDLKQKSIAVATAVTRVLNLRKQAAAAAISVALSASTRSIQAQRPVEETHAWQVVHRMSQINARNQAFSRKPRGE
jgi:Na+-transporting methylmalonyl-CoA/oxaloacetate decarboxylase gamma subunit